MDRMKKAIDGRIVSFMIAPWRLKRLLKHHAFDLKSSDIIYLLRQVDEKTMCFAKTPSISSYLENKDAKPFLAMLVPVINKHVEVLEYISLFANFAKVMVDNMDSSSLSLQMKMLELRSKALFVEVIKHRHIIHPQVMTKLEKTPELVGLYEMVIKKGKWLF